MKFTNGDYSIISKFYLIIVIKNMSKLYIVKNLSILNSVHLIWKNMTNIYLLIFDENIYIYDISFCNKMI